MSNKRGVITGWSIAGLLGLTLVCPWVVPLHDPVESDISGALQGSSWTHPLGTDELGRDMLSRVIFGARLSLGLGVVAVGIGLAFGVPIGAIAGYWGGRLDEVLMRIVDMMLSYPTLLLAIVVIATLGPGFVNATIAIGISKIPVLARVTRGAIVTIRQDAFVEAARALGASDSRILWRHVLPNAAETVIVQAALLTASAILAGSGLGFLGLGAQPPTPEWGTMVSKGRTYLRVAPRLVAVPGMAITIAVIGLNLMTEGFQKEGRRRAGWTW